MCIVRSLSLPQRLFYCLFHPLLLIFFTSIIITIWSTFSVIDVTIAKTFHTETKWNNTVVTSVSISTITTTATETSVATYQPTYSASIYSLNNSYIDGRLDHRLAPKNIEVICSHNPHRQHRYSQQTTSFSHNTISVSLQSTLNGFV